jgi:hypothetical protein
MGANPIIKIKKKRKKINTASCRGVYVCDDQASDGRRAGKKNLCILYP